jgi:hypothetical protein
VEKAGSKPKCVVCKGEHLAWSKNCSIRQKENTKARQRIERKPKYFKETPKQHPVGPTPAILGRVSPEGWREVIPKGKWKALGDITDKPQKGTGETAKRGRPITLSRAE